MKVGFMHDKSLFAIAFPIVALGFGLIWWQEGLMTAMGVVLIGFASGIRRSS